MSSSSSGGNGSDCFDQYNTAPYVAVAAVRAGVGAFSALCCLAMIAIIALHKKYRDFAQRLVLNLAVTAFIHSLSYTLARVNYYSDLRLLDPYCYFGGFLNLYSAWIEVLALMCIVYHLFVAGLLGRPAHPTRRLEALFWLGTYALPLLWCWLPFIRQSYRTSGGWCAIRTLSEDGCSGYVFGKVLQFALWYVPLYILLFATCSVCVAVAVKMHMNVHRWSGVYDDETRTRHQRLRMEIRPLLWFPFLYLILNTFSFIDRIYNAAQPDDPVVVLTFLHACTSPFRGAFVALVYTLAGGALGWSQVKATCRDCCCCSHDNSIKEYPAVAGDHDDSLSFHYDWKAM